MSRPSLAANAAFYWSSSSGVLSERGGTTAFGGGDSNGGGGSSAYVFSWPGFGKGEEVREAGDEGGTGIGNGIGISIGVSMGIGTVIGNGIGTGIDIGIGKGIGTCIGKIGKGISTDAGSTEGSGGCIDPSGWVHKAPVPIPVSILIPVTGGVAGEQPTPPARFPTREITFFSCLSLSPVLDSFYDIDRGVSGYF